jgi:hypothetical protein
LNAAGGQLLGTAMTIRHIRAGVELEPIVQDKFYDFNYQALINIADNPRVILPVNRNIFDQPKIRIIFLSQPFFAGRWAHFRMRLQHQRSHTNNTRKFTQPTVDAYS